VAGDDALCPAADASQQKDTKSTPAQPPSPPATVPGPLAAGTATTAAALASLGLIRVSSAAAPGAAVVRGLQSGACHVVVATVLTSPPAHTAVSPSSSSSSIRVVSSFAARAPVPPVDNSIPPSPFFYTIPKAFTRDVTRRNQMNALRSWLNLRTPGGRALSPRLLMFGDDPGVAEVAKELGVQHEPEVRRNEFGTPYLNYIMARAAQLAGPGAVVNFINTDIVLMSDYAEAYEAVWRLAAGRPFLMIGCRYNTPMTRTIDFADKDWEMSVVKEVRKTGKRFTEWGIDYYSHSSEEPVGVTREFVDKFVSGDEKNPLKTADAVAAYRVRHPKVQRPKNKKPQPRPRLAPMPGGNDATGTQGGGTTSSSGTTSGGTISSETSARRPLWEDVPPFLVGRFAWDNYLVSKAVTGYHNEYPNVVVDVTEIVTAVHINHDYGHVNRQGNQGEKMSNDKLAAGEIVAGTIFDSNYKLWRCPGGVLKVCPRDLGTALQMSPTPHPTLPPGVIKKRRAPKFNRAQQIHMCCDLFQESLHRGAP
jgi:hypothetical protein